LRRELSSKSYEWRKDRVKNRSDGKLRKKK
jgi:hypothetical protein